MDSRRKEQNIRKKEKEDSYELMHSTLEKMKKQLILLNYNEIEHVVTIKVQNEQIIEKDNIISKKDEIISQIDSVLREIEKECPKCYHNVKNIAKDE